MTKEHLGLALALNVPVFVVVTKVDMCPPNVMAETLKLLTRILKSPGCRKIPVIVQNKDDVICSATNFTSERLVVYKYLSSSQEHILPNFYCSLLLKKRYNSWISHNFSLLCICVIKGFSREIYCSPLSRFLAYKLFLYVWEVSYFRYLCRVYIENCYSIC